VTVAVQLPPPGTVVLWRGRTYTVREASPARLTRDRERVPMVRLASSSVRPRASEGRWIELWRVVKFASEIREPEQVPS
jgi:hypothetical protein